MNKNRSNGSEVKRFTAELIPTLNRCMIASAFCAGDQIAFGIKYDKRSTALQFQLDSDNPLIKKRIVKIQMFRNLETCKFCNLFFNIETLKNDSSDFRGRFVNVNNNFSRYLLQFSKEMYDFQSNDKGKSSNNYMTVSGWKLHDSDNDLLFYFVQRKCYNDVTKMNVIRTAGLQIATERGLDILEKFQNYYDSSIRKADPKKDEFPDFDEDDDIEEIEFFDEEFEEVE